MAELEQLGYRVTRQPFDASPRRLHAVSLVAAGIGWTALVTFPTLVLPVPEWAALALGGAGVAIVAAIGYAVGGGKGPRMGASVPAINLIATKATPAIWLVAHGDSKSQAFSLRTRVLATGAVGLGLLGFVITLVARLSGPLSWGIVMPTTMLLVGAATVLVRGPIGNDSPGAVDNASGVVAAVVAAAHLRGRNDVGVVLTDAEEFGMEGAHVFGREHAGEWFVNFDGLDGRGWCRIMEHRARGRPARDLHRLSEPVATALARTGVPTRRRPLPPGILVDGVALTAVGMRGVTVSRGDWVTLGVVHTESDDVTRVDASSAVQTGKAVAEAVTVFLG